MCCVSCIYADVWYETREQIPYKKRMYVDGTNTSLHGSVSDVRMLYNTGKIPALPLSYSIETWSGMTILIW